MKKKKKKIGTIILIVICFVGLCALLYPSVANYWNNNISTAAIMRYATAMHEIREEDYKEVWDQALQYNADMLALGSNFNLPGEMVDRYYECLDVTGVDIMGYIDIPKIGVSLPIYHGTSDEVLQTAVGHLAWSSLPTGGIGTHCCLSGHRGLANARLFTDLDMLREGDQFTLTILNEVLTYEVDRIRIVLPNEMSYLALDKDKDLCTLITCTPYGINTHRLLVRGHRVETVGPEARVISEAVLIDQLLVAVFLSIPILFLLLMAVMLKKPARKITLEQIISSQESEENK